MDRDYFKAVLPEPFRILGLALKPLSLGRYRLLRRFDCAFVSDELKSAETSDLIIGVLICSMRCDEFLRWANSDSFSKDIRTWSRKIYPWPYLGLIPRLGKWWRKKHSFNLIEKMGLFKRYVDESHQMPKYWDNGESGKSSRAHWSQSCEVVLRGELGWTAEEINEEPLSKALSDYLKWAENKGIVELMSDAELAQIEAMEKGAVWP